VCHLNDPTWLGKSTRLTRWLMCAKCTYNILLPLYYFLFFKNFFVSILTHVLVGFLCASNQLCTRVQVHRYIHDRRTWDKSIIKILFYHYAVYFGDWSCNITARLVRPASLKLVGFLFFVDPTVL